MNDRAARWATTRARRRRASRWSTAAMITALVTALLPAIASGGTSVSAASPTVRVTTAAADGPGSLVAAFELASTTRTIRTIVVDPAVAADTITPSSTPTFTGTQRLAFDGNGVTINGLDADVGLAFATAADVTVRNVRVVDAPTTGVQFDVEGAARPVRLRLFDVTVDGSFTGIDVNDARGGRGTSLIGRRLSAVNAEAALAVAVRNGGNASIDLRSSDVDGSGIGVAVSQAGSGSLIAKLVNVEVASDQFGLVLAEDDAGDARVTLTNLDVTGVQAVAVSEQGGGHLRANATNVEATGLSNLATFRESGRGNLIARLRNLTNVASGFQPVDEAVVVSEGGVGRLDASIWRLDLGGTAAAVDGVIAEQGAPGIGRLRLVGSDLTGVTGDATDRTGVDRFFDFNNRYRGSAGSAVVAI